MNAARAAGVVVAAAVVVGLAGGAAAPEARQVYAPVWRQPVVEAVPCFLSAFLPPSDAEHCIAWTRRESAGPAFHADTGILLIGGSDKKLHALDAHEGKPLYAVPIPGALTTTPTLDGDAAFFGTDDGHVLRADVSSGKSRWDVVVDAEIEEPVVVDGDLVFAVTGADTLFALNKTTGEAAWSYKHPLPRGITLRGQSRPLVMTVATPEGPKRRVFIGHASGRLTILDRATGTVVDELNISGDDTFGDLDADPFEQNGHVVLASNTKGVMAIDPRTGAELWKTPEPGIVRLARGGNHMVVAAGPQKILGLDAKSGAIRWRFTFDKGSPTRLNVKGGRVQVGSDRSSLFVLDLFSGRPMQYIGSGLGFAADIELWNDMLFATTSAGDVIAYSNGWRGLVQAKR
ncbi:MAG TPA: PQQ-binding-like beta-propeller repeat protein [Myxococcota bacterium]|jgi:outer membrane protein assembly factor BamB